MECSTCSAIRGDIPADILIENLNFVVYTLPNRPLEIIVATRQHIAWPETQTDFWDLIQVVLDAAKLAGVFNTRFKVYVDKDSSHFRLFLRIE